MRWWERLLPRSLGAALLPVPWCERRFLRIDLATWLGALVMTVAIQATGLIHPALPWMMLAAIAAVALWGAADRIIAWFRGRLGVETIGLLILQAVGVESFTIFGTLTLAQVVGTVALTAGLIGLQLALAPGAPKPENGHQALRQTIPERVGALGGPQRLAAAYMLYEEYNNVSVDVVAIASGNICGVRQYMLHEDYVVIDPLTGIVQRAIGVADKRYQGNNVTIKTRLGLESETAYPEVIAALPSGVWTTAHKLNGTASLALICKGVKLADFPKTYPNVKPEPSLIIDGFALWDPRDPNQDPDDPATWVNYPNWDSGTTYAAGDRVLFGGAVYYSRISGNVGVSPWSWGQSGSGDTSDSSPFVMTENNDEWCAVGNNPVLQWIYFNVFAESGEKWNRETVIDPVIDALMAEADLCDELVEKKNGDFEPRYCCRTFYKFTNNPEDVVGPILASCDGWTQENGDGTFSLYVGVYRAPTITISSVHILGFAVTDGTLDEERINEFAISFTSPSHKFKEVPGQPWRDEESISETGSTRSQPLSLITVQSHAQARRLAKRAMLRVSSALKVKLTLSLYGLRLLGQRWFTLQWPFYPGLENAVLEVQPDPEIDIVNGTVTVDAIVINPNIIDAWDPDSEEGSAPPLPDGVPSDDLPVPQDLLGTAAGAPPFHFDLSWDDPDRDDLSYVVQYRLADAGGGVPGPWAEATFSDPTKSGGRLFVTIYPATEADYIVQVASVGSLGSRSDWSDSITITLGTVLLLEDGTSLLLEDGSTIKLES